MLKAGDSEDCEILRVSLLRAAGIPESEIFVVLASDGITTQAWLREVNAPFEAGNIEPWYRHGFYNAVYYFNDVEANRYP